MIPASILFAKRTVDVSNMAPEILFGVMVAFTVYASYEYDCVITRAFDRADDQLPTSLHNRDNRCRAVDIRINHLKDEMVKPLYNRLCLSLPPGFDCVLESDHIHLEWDPKPGG